MLLKVSTHQRDLAKTAKPSQQWRDEGEAYAPR
jgi:hypothetical protein